MAPGEEPRAREVDDVFAFVNWQDGALVYQATPLAQVVQEVSRHYGRELRVEGPTLAQRRVTAWFQDEPFEAVAESLCIVTEAICRTGGESVTMEQGGDEGTI
jgi:ferric-dicitrate binding protein FerR (iron transport regulator)